MTFLNDIWKKFNAPVINKKWEVNTNDNEKTGEDTLKSDPSITLQNVKKAFNDTEKENLQSMQLINNLKALKELVDKPKEENLEVRFQKINQYLGEAETHETVRRDRWPVSINCPSCQSNNLKRLMQTSSKSSHNHRYQCLNCGLEFNDDDEAPIEKGIPPINIWMQCWYLMGCTDSLNYIAAKLNLDIGVVETMVRHLQKLFNAQKPLTQFLKYEEWDKQSQHMRNQLKADLLKQYEFLDANIATAPKDTTEFRRQQNLRRMASTTEPPSPTIGKKKL